MILFVQPFSFGSAGGGARILRALLQDCPARSILVCTSPEAPRIVDPAREVHLPLRPYFGKIERTRLAALPALVTPLFKQQFVHRFEQLCRDRGGRAVHAIPHCELDFHHAQQVAAKLGLPFYLQMHDDFAYSSRGYVTPKRAHAAMQSAWRNAEARFVICDQLGNEYCRRYGGRDYIIVTDGLESVASMPSTRAPGELRIYFMGLFHLEYEENLRALCVALKRMRSVRPSVRVSITLRCGTLRPQVARIARDMIRVLPFGTEADVQRDLKCADLLYLPLPFGAQFDPLVRFSLSTKMVTYLGSGVPILYHGPQTSVAYELLTGHSAALPHPSLDVDSLAETLGRICDERGRASEISGNALKLARSRFMLQDQRAKFWNAMTRTAAGNAAATNSLQSVANTR
jgi:glycosyltransferase involved in cell wall biosynthesis